MRNATRLTIVSMLLLFAGESASAQQEIVIDNVTNSAAGMYLFAGRTHVFNIRYTNFKPLVCQEYGMNINNGYVLTSPDGATWTHTFASLAPAFDSLIWTQKFINQFDNPFPGGDPGSTPGDGVSPDYIGMAGFNFGTSPLSGLVNGFDDIALEIEILTNTSDTNLHICIDKSEIGRLNTWQWVGNGIAMCNVAPTWAGQKCYTIIPGCCIGRKGNIDLDPFGNVDITDVTLLIDHLFISFPPLPCIDEANIDGDPAGKVDIVDLTLLLDHLFVTFPQLPFCQ